MTEGRERMARAALVGAKGYTLLEVLVALAILATAMAVLMGSQANANQQAVFSNDLTTASMLARSKMIDIEFELTREGMSTLDQKLSGDFREEGHPEVEWEATIEPVEIPAETRDELLAKINSQLFGGQDQAGALQGNAAFSAMLPMLIGQLPDMINRVGEKVRRVELVVEFPYGGATYPITVVQYVVDKDSAQFDLFAQPEGQ